MKIGIRPLVLGLMLASPAAWGQSHPDLGNLVDFPIASEVWLGSLVGEVSVNPKHPIEISRPGEFSWSVADGASVSEDQVVAITGTKSIELSERTLALEQSRLRQKMQDIEWGSQDKRTTLRGTVRELENTLARLDLTKTEKDLLGSDFAKRLLKERREVEAELERARQKLDGDYFDSLEKQDKQSLDLDLEKAEQEHKDLRRSSEIVAPTSGRLEILVREDIRRITVVGNVIKQGLAEAAVDLVDPRLRNVPGPELVVEIRGDDGIVYRGAYLKELERQGYTKNTRSVVFEIARADGDKGVPETLAGARMLRVFRKLGKPGHLVPKSDLVFKFPKEIGEIGWAAFITKRWPGATVAYVAPREIVVTTPDEN